MNNLLNGLLWTHTLFLLSLMNISIFPNAGLYGVKPSCICVCVDTNLTFEGLRCGLCVIGLLDL